MFVVWHGTKNVIEIAFLSYRLENSIAIFGSNFVVKLVNGISTHLSLLYQMSKDNSVGPVDDNAFRIGCIFVFFISFIFRLDATPPRFNSSSHNSIPFYLILQMSCYTKLVLIDKIRNGGFSQHITNESFLDFTRNQILVDRS